MEQDAARARLAEAQRRLDEDEGDVVAWRRLFSSLTALGKQQVVERHVDRALALPNLQLKASSPPGLHPTRSAEVVIAGRTRGHVGEVDPAVLESYGVEGRVAWLELDLGAILNGPHGNRKYTPVSKFPSSDIDLAFVAPDDVVAAQVEASLRKGGGALLVGLDLFDVYRGEGVDEGRKSVAYAFHYRSQEGTLKDKQVDAVHEKVIEQLRGDLDATIRG